MSEGVTGLLVQAILRLSGQGVEPVIELKTAFGGGKTHSELALYHIGKSGITVERAPNLKEVLAR